MVGALMDRMTPWVGRLIAINAVVLLLQQTLFPSPVLQHLITFDPALAISRPWTFFTYIFFHGGLLHLAGNSLALFVFGPAVEERLGSRAFILYYLFCGVGAAVVSLLFWFVAPNFIYPFIGASGAVLGVALAFAKFNPDAELFIFPLPMPIKARTLIAIIAVFDVVGALLANDGVAHVAHLGGLLCGWLYFTIQGSGSPYEPPRITPSRPRVPVSAPASRSDGMERRPARQPDPTPVVPERDLAAEEQAEMNRLLDKISAKGIASLSSGERQYLDDVARRRREGNG